MAFEIRKLLPEDERAGFRSGVSLQMFKDVSEFGEPMLNNMLVVNAMEMETAWNHSCANRQPNWMAGKLGRSATWDRCPASWPAYWADRARPADAAVRYGNARMSIGRWQQVSAPALFDLMGPMLRPRDGDARSAFAPKGPILDEGASVPPPQRVWGEHPQARKRP